MTSVLSLPSAQYSPRTITRTFTIPATASVRAVRATFTKEGWPPVESGEVLMVEVLYPDGTSGGVVGFSGGDTRARDGSLTCSMRLQPPDGEPDLPNGTYTVIARILQTIRMAVTVERF